VPVFELASYVMDLLQAQSRPGPGGDAQCLAVSQWQDGYLSVEDPGRRLVRGYCTFDDLRDHNLNLSSVLSQLLELEGP